MHKQNEGQTRTAKIDKLTGEPIVDIQPSTSDILYNVIKKMNTTSKSFDKTLNILSKQGQKQKIEATIVELYNRLQSGRIEPEDNNMHEFIHNGYKLWYSYDVGALRLINLFEVDK